MRNLCVLFGLSLVLVPSSLFAQSVEVGGQVFADYSVQTSPTSIDSDGNTYKPSAFDVSRAYINVTGKVSPKMTFRVTPDITRDAVNGDLKFRAKYAYLQFNPGKPLSVRFGMQPTPYLDYTEGIYKYRFQGTMLAERNGYFKSSDVGVSAHYDLPEGYGDLQGGAFNGENYDQPETNDQKSVQFRVSVRPLPKMKVAKGLRTTLFFDQNTYVKDARRDRFMFNATFENKHINVGAEYLSAKDTVSAFESVYRTNAYSLWATPKLGKGFEVLARLDKLNTGDPCHSPSRKIVGLAYWIKKSTAIMFDMDRTTVHSDDDLPVTRFAIHTVVNF